MKDSGFFRSPTMLVGYAGTIITALVGSALFNGSSEGGIKSLGLSWLFMRQFLWEQGGWLPAVLGGIAAALIASAKQKMRAGNQ